MEFVPTATDYFLLIVFVLLALVSGWFSFLFFCCGSSEEGSKSESSKWRWNAIRPPGKPGSITILEMVLLILINTFLMSSFVLLLTAQLGLFRFRYWCLF